MTIDMLVLDSGEWLLSEELAASPWRVLIYRQRGEPRNELHLWLPREGAPRSKDFAFKRYWLAGGERWCVEAPPMVARRGEAPRLRFTSDDGRVLWAVNRDSGRGLADLSERELVALLRHASEGPYVWS